MEEYKGYVIEYNVYGRGEYSVQYCGDDMVFYTLDDAKAFVDSVAEEV